MWAFFVVKLGFDDERFFDLTLEQVSSLQFEYRRKLRDEMTGSALVASVVANVHLPKHKKMTVDDFLPEFEEEKKPASTQAVIAMFMAHVKTEVITRGAS